MLIQLHHQFKDNTEFIAQKDIKNNQDLRDLIDEMQEEYPIPDDAQWMVCTEKSRHFLKTHKDLTSSSSSEYCFDISKEGVLNEF